MGCLYLLLALISPRLLLIVLWVFTHYVQPKAFDFFLWPLLGLIFLPWTTLAVVWGYNTHFGILQIGAIVLGVVLDLGSTGGAEKQRRRRVK
jgi:hypothetical protein